MVIAIVCRATAVKLFLIFLVICHQQFPLAAKAP
jgi:hypothetical protein